MGFFTKNSKPSVPIGLAALIAGGGASCGKGPMSVSGRRGTVGTYGDENRLVKTDGAGAADIRRARAGTRDRRAIAGATASYLACSL